VHCMCMRVCVHACSNLVSVRASTWGLDDNDSSKRTTMHGLHDLCKVGSTITISCTSVVQSGALVYIFSCTVVDIHHVCILVLPHVCVSVAEGKLVLRSLVMQLRRRMPPKALTADGIHEVGVCVLFRAVCASIGLPCECV
jgi:hypothetical protein